MSLVSLNNEFLGALVINAVCPFGPPFAGFCFWDFKGRKRQEV